MGLLRRAGTFLTLVFYLFVITLLLGSSEVQRDNQIERVRTFTREIEFDYVGWTINALRVKLNQFALGSETYLSVDARKQLVLDYLDLVARLQQGEAQLNQIYADPGVSDPEATSADLRKQLVDLRGRREQLAPVAEAVLQGQVAEVAADFGLTIGGQPVPPVLYHSTPLPHALIVSPRNIIRQDADISILADFPVDEQAALEERVDQNLDVSSLVVGIGGVGLYPTMVQQTNNLDWLSEVVSHEWVHNFLTLRPLGVNYMSSPALRIMNETTASIAGKEMGTRLLERFYPELLPPPTPQTPAPTPAPEKTAEPPAFNYVAEMHETRVNVDRLLADGKIEEAEKYMEDRRVVFWENHYSIRKINQAYFAFYGAYADEPGGGAAGEDPVGAAVRLLREQSPNLEVFLNRISWMWSFEQLQEAVESNT